ncbi:DUF3027 domain-containing protein [Nocardia sp. CT2-14]|uniref:DUF3027 domain-containing protein n=1 Tax=Nocardia aurantiaca TaxID=2675850 RepID=A0A6I3KRB9_9NOCA|nr:DUF3027 domain-containing protein [Nocardia aurantiaca]
MSAVGVSESGVRPILAEAVELARRALLDLEPVGVGAHLGVTGEDESSATHHFEATLPGYRGWQWAVVVAAPPEATVATVSESALLPSPDALVAPDFVPWEQRIRPGDLAPGDLLAPPPGDPRLVPGYVATGDPAVDEVTLEIGLGRTQVLSREGREESADRWFSEYGPDTDMARAAPSTCGLCGFYVPLAGALGAAFGVCANAMGADGHVVHVAYGCGAHSDVELPTGNGSPIYEAYDDAAVDLIPAADLREESSAIADRVEAGDAAVGEAQAADAADTEPVANAPIADVADAGAAEAEVADADVADAGAAEVAEAEAADAGAAESDVADADVADAGAAEAEVAEAEVAEARAAVVGSDVDVTAVAVSGEGDSAGAGAEAAENAVAAEDSAAAAEEPAPAVEASAVGLFEVGDPDAVYDDAWAVNAVRAEPEAGSPESR